MDNGKTMGDYYRDLSTNYYYYSLEADDPRKMPWPERPAGAPPAYDGSDLY